MVLWTCRCFLKTEGLKPKYDGFYAPGRGLVSSAPLDAHRAMTATRVSIASRFRRHAPPFSQVMPSRRFVKAVVLRVRSNLEADPKTGPFVYSIRVVDPPIFHTNHELAVPSDVGPSAINLGSIYSQDLYGQDPDRLRNVLLGIIQSGARAVEVKVSDEPGGPWEIIRVHLAH